MGLELFGIGTIGGGGGGWNGAFVRPSVRSSALRTMVANECERVGSPIWAAAAGGTGVAPNASRPEEPGRVRAHLLGESGPRFTSASVMVRNSSSVSASVRLSARAAGANVLARRVGTTANAVCRAAGARAAARLSARAPRAHHAVPLRSVVAVAFIL